jgi:hypothetical protein
VKKQAEELAARIKSESRFHRPTYKDVPAGFMAFSCRREPIAIAFQRVGGLLWHCSQVVEAVMAKYWPARKAGSCAVVAEDAAGHWVARGAGRRPHAADSATAAILDALYGDHPAGAVLLLPPGSGTKN